MTFYTSNVSTKILNSVFNQSKYRSEMRIVEDGLYLSNMRLLNVGLVGTAGAYAADRRYAHLCGVHGQIRNISLYDGKVVLDQIVGYNDWSGFQAYNHSNQANSDIYKVLSRNGMGFVYDRLPNANGAATNQPLIKEQYPNSASTPNEYEYETPLGFINLRDVFPLLRKLEFLHTALFKNLRVVIEYDVNNTITGTGGFASNAIAATAIPILVVDQLNDAAFASKVLSEFKSVVWDAIEVEAVHLPAKAVDGEQSLKFRLSGFTNKSLVSLLIQKKPLSVISGLYQNHGSVNMVDEKIQLVVNGGNWLPLEGVTRSNERLSMLHDSYGVSNAHPCSADLAMYGVANFIEEPVARVGQLDYFGVMINKPITHLDLVYSRLFKSAYGARYGQACTLNVFGTVLKSIVKTKDGYSVVYV